MADKQPSPEFLKFWAHIPWSTQNETLIILKGHLLIEDLLREFCYSKTENPDELMGARLSFSQVSKLCRALMKNKAETWTWDCISRLNDLRNMLAHKLEPKDFELKRTAFIELAISGSNEEDLFSSFPQPFEQLAVSIFVTYIALAVRLKFQSPMFSLPDLARIDSSGTP